MHNQEVQRWDIVIYSTLIMLICSYCMQEIPSLHSYLKENFIEQKIQGYQYDEYINISQSVSFGLLIFLASYVGYLIDKFKPGIIFVVQTFLLSFSQFLVFLSIYLNKFWILLAGRTLLYLVCSPMFITSKVLINNLTTQSYKGTSLGIAFLSVIGYGLSLQIEPFFVDSFGLQTCTFITFTLASATFIFSLICFRIEEAESISKLKELSYIDMNQNIENKRDDHQINLQEHEQIIQHESYLQQMKNLDILYWIFAPINFLSIVVCTVVEVCGPALISSQWNYNATLSTQINSISQLLGVFMPLLGYILDKINKDYEWIILAMLNQLIGIFLLGFISPLIGFIVFGIAFCLRISVQSPYLTKIVPKNNLGKAVGLIRSLKDFFAMIMFFYISQSVKITHSYHNIILALIMISLLVFLLSIGLLIVSKKKKE
ncbi:MFS transporter (macronuclear) [Tetrahymena thermophila SB210]|uniref:Lysosomal dipeptide transporter MFSD1 n=1 Tax=Tetrahymena thermophila (strain SB210) TaxID=312017 RepID=X1W3T6_TETTS|nr:MFS transporter [Tetrahymena thermophila SB210]EDK31891.1 MFS transporter [Tetrahymena thermophila SB210]|eukprot:XP_001470749.1 MFS transporter [Tetrahymena thermophila SB210]